MHLISEAYRQTNKVLHEADPSYGTAGGLIAPIVKTMSERLGTRSILDYGCGKRILQRELGFSIANYDPAISGYDAVPDPADIVVCGDVLEHVEPECLDAVLADLVRVTNRAIIIVPATGPARKSLPDGRNRHLIQERADWWLAKFEKAFRLSRFFTTGNGCVFIGQSFRDTENFPNFADIGPPPETTVITVKSVFTAEQRCTNIRSSILRGLPTLKMLPVHKNTMVLACYGPSLKHTLPQLSDDLANGGDLYTTSGAHQFLIDRGYEPIGHIEADPRPIAATRFGKPRLQTCYFLSSACSREAFEAVHGFETYIFHVDSFDEERELIEKLHPGQLLLSAGTNVGTTAFALGYALGYRKFLIHGMDCSFEAGEEFLNWPRDKDMPSDVLRRAVGFHAGKHPEEDQQVYRVWVGDRPFITSPQMMQGAQDFLLMRGKPRKGFSYALRGDGFLVNVDKHLRRRPPELKMKGFVHAPASADIHRLRPETVGIVHHAGELNYKARLKAGLFDAARHRKSAA